MLNRVLASFVCLLGLSGVVDAAEFSRTNYDIYYGDINGDGKNDVYFHGKSNIVLLHGDIVTPIIVLPPTSYSLETYSTTTPIYGNGGVETGSTTHWHIDAAPTPYAPPLTQQEITDLGLILLPEGEQFRRADFDGDGVLDVLVEMPDVARVVIFRGRNGATDPTILQTFSSTAAYTILNNDYALRDVDADGKLDIVFPAADEQYADLTYYVGKGSHVAGYDLTEPAALPATQVGSTAGSFRVSESGAAEYTIPLALPQGIAGVAPEVALNYSSQGGSAQMGVGWSLSAGGQISRCRATLYIDGEAKPITMTEDDKFCLNGSRLVVVEGVYGHPGSRYKTHIDQDVWVYAVGGSAGHPAHFEVVAKDGSRRIFGGTPDSRVDVAGGTYTWALSREEDNFANGVNYHYSGGLKNHRLERISYASGFAEVDFQYSENRPDVSKNILFGSETEVSSRLDRVVISEGSNAFRVYELSYLRVTKHEKSSRLFRIQECASLGQNCLPPTEFDWIARGASNSNYNTQPDFSVYPTPDLERVVVGFKLADINGDGCQDAVIGWWHSVNKVFDTGIMFADNKCTHYKVLDSFASYDASGVGSPKYFMEVIDYNLDGRSDVLIRYRESDPWKIYLSRPKADGSWALSASSSQYPDTGDAIGSMFVDIDSDGLPDNVHKNRAWMARRAINNDDAQPYEFSEERVLSSSGELVGSGDFNGDGIVDLVFYDSVSGYRDSTSCDSYEEHVAGCLNDLTRSGRTYLRIMLVDSEGGQQLFKRFGSGWVSCGSADPDCVSQPISEPLPARNVVVADFNGDGYSDLILQRDGAYELFLNDGTGLGFVEGSARLTPTSAERESGEFSDYLLHRLKSPTVVDYDGDGDLDLYWNYFWEEANTKSLLVALWNSETSTFDKQISPISAGSVNSSFYFADVNGDSQLDVVKVESASDSLIRIFLNRNQDIEAVVSGIKNGAGNKVEITYERMNKTENYARIQIEPQYQTVNSPCYVGGGGNPVSTCTNRLLHFSSFYAAMNNPFGLLYSDPEFHRPVFEVFTPMPLVTRVASSAPIGGDAQAQAKVSYFYTQAKIQAGGRGFLGFESVISVDEQTSIETTTEYLQQFPYTGTPKRTTVRTAEGEILSVAENEYAQYQPQGANYIQLRLSKSEETSYATYTDGSQADGLRVDDPAESNPVSVTTTEYDYDAHGNVTWMEQRTYGWTAAANDESVEEYFENRLTTDNSYSGSASISLHGRTYSYAQLGRLTSVAKTGTRILERNGVRTELPMEARSVATTYYPNGMVHEEKVEAGGDQAYELTTELVYDSFGNTVQKNVTGWDGEANVTRTVNFEYDAEGRYLEASYNGLGHVVERVVERHPFGWPTLVEGATEAQVTITYDVFGRERTRTDNTATQNTVTTTHHWCSSSAVQCPAGAKTASVTEKQNGVRSIEYFDVLGRTVRTATQNFDGTYVYVDTEYDIQGNVQRSSEPYQYTPQYWTQYQYDILSRPLQISAPAFGNTVATSTVDYAGNRKITTTPTGYIKTEVSNALGELVAVIDRDSLGMQYATIVYEYDAEGRLRYTRVRPSEGGELVTSLSYDRLGRKTAMNDPDKGAWTYTYNAFGELLDQVSAKGALTRTRYDALGRSVSRTDYPDQNNLELIESYTRWYYDGATDQSSTTTPGALGKVSATVMSRGVAVDTCTANSVQHCSYQVYDEYGRAVRNEVHVNADDVDTTPRELFVSRTVYSAITGHVDTVYDPLNALVRDANGAAIASGVKHHYNARGFLSHITDLHRSGEELYRVIATDARGQVLTANVGGYVRSMRYDEATGLVRRLYAHAGGALSYGETPDAFTVQHVTYAWDAAHNLSSRHNQSAQRANGNVTSQNNLKEQFCYDKLNRLIKTNIESTGGPINCANVTTAQQDMRYSSIGNITYKAGVGDYSYSSTRPHAVSNTSVGDLDYHYDDNGNLTNDDTGRTLQYSVFDKPTRIQKGTHISTFAYGPDRARYMHKESNTGNSAKNKTTLYLGGVERIQLADGTFEWRRALTNTLITYTTDNSFTMLGDEVRHYQFADHLGSLDVIGDEWGNVVQNLSFNAWGERRLENASLSVLSDTALYNFDDSITSRGYTGHEMLDELGLIHMNGRIYDAKLARFVQADPFIQVATDVQMYNRYSYVRNNPLNATDPSGFISFGIIDSINDEAKRRGRRAIRDLSHVFGADVVNFAGSLVMTYVGGAFGAALWSYEFARAMGASSSQALYSAGVTFVSAMAFHAIGQQAQAGGWDPWQKALAHGIVGGITSVMQGGKFGHGFFSAGVTKYLGSKMFTDINTNRDWTAVARRTMTAALIGGTVSALTGGKFANGAKMAAIAHLVNGERSGAAENARIKRENARQHYLKYGVYPRVDGKREIPGTWDKLQRSWIVMRGVDVKEEFNAYLEDNPDLVNGTRLTVTGLSIPYRTFAYLDAGLGAGDVIVDLSNENYIEAFIGAASIVAGEGASYYLRGFDFGEVVQRSAAAAAGLATTEILNSDCHVCEK